MPFTSRMRTRLLATGVPVAIAVLLLSACTARSMASTVSGAPNRPSASPSASEGDAAQPTPEPEPTGAPGSPTPEPPAPTTPPPPPPTPVQPVKLPVQTGKGPNGSLKTTGNETVALTFDDGPDPKYTPQILDLLKAAGVKATFCLVGKQARANPGLVKRIFVEGHTLCDHTWAHSLDLGKQPPEVMMKDLRDTLDAIHAAVPDAPVRYFRAPGGNFTAGLTDVAAQLGMRSLYWAVDTRDWEYSKWGHGQTMVDHIIGVVQSKTRRGSIILSHDYQKPDTIAAYKTLLPWLKANVTLVAMPV